MAVAAPASLKTQLSRWENQHVLPEEHYRALLRELYGGTDGELGLTDPTPTDRADADDAEALRAALAVSAAIDGSGIELLRAQLRATRAVDHRLGAVAVVESAGAQLSQLERALSHAVRRQARTALARLVVEAATLVGRVMLDLSAPAAAWRHLETAKHAAHEAESMLLVGCAMVEQGGVLLEVGMCERALEMIEQAVSLAGGDAPAPLRAWFAANEGGALAAAGAAGQAHLAFHSAERQLTSRPPRVDVQIPELPIEFDLTALHRHRGHALQVLRDDASAVPELELALRGGGSARDQAGVHVDLAHAFGATGHPEAASDHARSARELTERIGSTRLAARLDAWPRTDDRSVTRS